MASESTPPPPSGGGARYAIAGVALAAVCVLGYCMLNPGTPPPTTVAAVAPDAGVTRSTALVDDSLVIPEEEPDAGPPVDAYVPGEVVHRPSGPRAPTLGEWESCSGEMDARPVFEEYRSQFQACYEHRLKAAPMLQGQMMLQVRVAGDGHVDGVQVGGSLHDREVFTCVRNLANRMHFPHVTGGTCAVVAVPYTFTPQQ